MTNPRGRRKLESEIAVNEYFDRRKDPRWTPNVPVQMRWHQGGRTETLAVKDLSLGGLRIESGTCPPIGTYVPVSIAFSGTNEINLEVRVVWKRPGVSAESAHKVGLMVLQRRDVDKYQTQVLTFKEPSPIDRRFQDRRLVNLQQLNTSTERRQDKRRGTSGISKRLSVSGQSLDRWISRYTYERLIQSAPGPTVKTQDRTKIMLGSNNYLGLSDHPKVKEATIKAIEKYGVGAGGVRVLSGTMDLHKALEHRLAEFKSAEACLLYSSGFVANLAVLTSILRKGDVVLNDEVNHASIVEGCRSSDAVVRFYKHKDLVGLARKLSQYHRDTPKLIITDGVFSMDGDVAPLKEILGLAKKFNAMLMVDDAHATGVIGPTGRGSAEYCGVKGLVDITTVTLSKALGAVGGAICGSRSLIKHIFNLSKPFIYSSALPPSVCASTLAALDVLESNPCLIENIHKNRSFLVSGLKTLGFNVPDSVSAVIPVIIGDEIKTYKMASRLDELNIFVNAVSRPAVPRELSRLRISVMATHKLEQLEEALFAFKKAGKEIGLI